MQLIEMEITDLHEADYNPRLALEVGTPEFAKLKTAIEKFDMVEPLVWNKRTGNVVGGNQRLAVMKYLGKTKTPVSVIDVDETQEKLLSVALNKIKGSWDFEKLENLFAEFDYASLGITGFGADEIALIFEEDNEGYDTYETEDDVFGTVQTYGESWVIQLKFETVDAAKNFAKKEKLPVKIKDDTRTTVYRIED